LGGGRNETKLALVAEAFERMPHKLLVDGLDNIVALCDCETVLSESVQNSLESVGPQRDSQPSVPYLFYCLGPFLSISVRLL